MAKRQSSADRADQNAFSFATPEQPEQESDSVLTLVQTPTSPLDKAMSSDRRTGRPALPVSGALGVQTPRLGVHQRGTGRPDAQHSRFEPREENDYPSRKKARLNLRGLDRKLLKTVKKECESVDPPLNLNAVTQDAWKLWLRSRTEARLGVQTPTCSSSSGSSSGGESDLDLTTTTTTLGVRTPKSVALPGFVASILEHVQHKSRHSLEVNLAYAWESFQKNEGIRAPDVWAMKNWENGKADALVDLWVQRKQQEAEKEMARLNKQKQELAARRSSIEKTLERGTKRSNQFAEESALTELDRLSLVAELDQVNEEESKLTAREQQLSKPWTS